MRCRPLWLWAVVPLSAYAGDDLDPVDGCEDTAFADNGACIHPSVDLGGNPVGGRAAIGPNVQFVGTVLVAPKATLAGSSDATVRTVTGPTSIGRRAAVGYDFTIGGFNTWSRAVSAGDRLLTEGNVTLGYGASVGDDVTLRGGAVLANLSVLGDWVVVGTGSRVGRESTVYSGTEARPTQVLGSVGPGVEIGSSAVIEDSAHIGRDAIIGANATVEMGGRVGRGAVLYDGARLGVGATIRAGAQVLPNAEVPPYTYVGRGETWSECGTTPGTPIVLSTPTTISALDTAYECADLVISSLVTVSGPHSFRSLTIASGGTLTHPAREYDGVLVTLSGPLDVQSGGTIDVTGKGGLGGSHADNGNYFGERWTLAGWDRAGASEHRAGGSYGSRGVSMTRASGPVVGDPRNPRELGSGGGGNSQRGGNGGGRVDITATNVIVNGQILANGSGGAGYHCGGGSGGAIRLFATGTVTGSGVLRAAGESGNANKGAGGDGRIAVTGFTTNSFSGTLDGATVFFLAADRTQGIYRVDGSEAALTILANESPVDFLLANSASLTSNVAFSDASDFVIDGSLTMNAPFTIGGEVTVARGASTFNDTVSASTWTHSAGTATFNGSLDAATWTQVGGTVTLNGAVTNTAWTQTGGSAILGATATFAPGTFSLANTSFTTAGTVTLPALSAATLSASTTVTNTGGMTLSDAAIEIPAGVTVQQDGVWAATGQPADTFASLTVSGTLRRTVQTQQGFRLAVLGSLTVPTGGLVDVSGAGGRGATGGEFTTDVKFHGERWTPTGPVVDEDGSENRAGGSYASVGEFRTRGPGPTYGDPRNPIAYGSGGGTSYSLSYNTPGGNGGGRLDITAGDLVLDGELRANGSSCPANCGSGAGGSIRAVVSGTVSGAGTLRAVGGAGTPTGSNINRGYGGGGRIAVRDFTTSTFSGTTQAATVFFRAVDGSQGIFLVDGTEAHLTIEAGDTPTAIAIANGGGLTSDIALSWPSLDINGDLTMNAPFTATGAVTVTRGTSVFNGPVDVGSWTQSGGIVTFEDSLAAPTWTQSGGTANLNGAVTTTSWTNTGGTLTVGTTGTLAPPAVSLSNTSFTNAGDTTLPTLDAATVSGSSALTNTGTLTISDDTLVEVATGVTVQQDGVLAAVGQPADTVNALRVTGTLKRTVQTMEGLHLAVLGLLDVQTGGVVDVSYAGGRGGRGKAASDPTSYYYGERWTLTGPTTDGGAYNRSGGSYGTSGEDRNGAPGPVYGDPLDPFEYGSGGGATSIYSPGGAGGGRLDLTATDVIVNGELRSNGAGCSANCGAGSGGAIRVVLTGDLTGAGVLNAKGGPGNPAVDKGYGGGGRVAIIGNATGSFTGTFDAGSVYVNGAVQ